MDPFEGYEARIKELEKNNTELTEKVEYLRGFITRMNIRVGSLPMPAIVRWAMTPDPKSRGLDTSNSIT